MQQFTLAAGVYTTTSIIWPAHETIIPKTLHDESRDSEEASVDAEKNAKSAVMQV
jgi:hypothetical protein